MTAPPNYWPMRRRLLRRGASRVDICSLWPPDWALAGLVGFGPLLRRTGSAIARTYRMAGRRPIMVIGHSGGGICARLAMSDAPYRGQRAGVAEAVGCLVTLGTPHRLAELSNRYRHAGHAAAEFLDRECPGAYFAPRTGYLTVGSSRRVGAAGGPLGRVVDEFFKLVVGGDAYLGSDGIVPASAVHLAGARQVTYDDVLHGHFGRLWYGGDEVVDRWWPLAVELWRDALAARQPSLAVPALTGTPSSA